MRLVDQLARLVAAGTVGAVAGSMFSMHVSGKLGPAWQAVTQLAVAFIGPS